MRKIFINFLVLIIVTLAHHLISSSIFAQSPQKMNFQAVIRNSSDQLVTNHSVGIRISILQGSPTGAPVYVETHFITSNSNGLVIIELGGGTPVSGNFAYIDWSAGTFFIKTEADPNGGTSYSITGASQILSVPYALYAQTAENGYEPYNNIGDMVYWNGTIWEIIPVGKKGQFLQLTDLNSPGWSGNYYPISTTSSVTSITTTSATSGGNITDDGGASVTARGVCWSTTQNPTIANNKTTDGTGTGSFTSSLTGLTDATTYFVRSYATNSIGTGYGYQRIFTTNSILTTSAVSLITPTSAISGGIIASDGGNPITARGVCWSLNQNPTIANSKTVDGTGTGTYTSYVSGLTESTTYYLRSYFTNSSGTTYGSQISFTTVPVSSVLTTALNSTAMLMNTPDNFGFVYQWYGLWSISGGYSQNPVMTRYNLMNSSFQMIWSKAYTNIYHYNYIDLTSATASLKSFRAIAKIMKVYLYQILVDVYGNVPYSQAFKINQGIMKPSYDAQQAIYEDLVIQLDLAINTIATTPPDAEAVGAKDIIYGGDMGKWARFANTLKLRILMNQADMVGLSSYISSALSTTSSVGYMVSGEGAWLNPGYVQSTGKMSPFWERFYKQDGSQQADGLGYYVAGQDACDFLTANNDPRKLRFFQAYTGTSIQGNYFGALVLQTVPNTSKLGPGMLQSYNQNAAIMTDIESLFLQAEAAQRGFIAGSAKAFYESAVTRSVIYEGGQYGTAIDAATYLAQPGKPLVNFDVSSNKLQAIITQKWCALNGLSPMPVWTDYRRTGYPDFIHWSADPAKVNPTPPVRMIYPQTEIDTNNENVLLQGPIDPFTSKIFWQNR